MRPSRSQASTAASTRSSRCDSKPMSPAGVNDVELRAIAHRLRGSIVQQPPERSSCASACFFPVPPSGGASFGKFPSSRHRGPPTSSSKELVTSPESEGLRQFSEAHVALPHQSQLHQSPGTRILVVDDDRATRRLFVMTLELAGYECVEAGSGAEALERIDATIAAVVLDNRLPDGLGVDLLHKLRGRLGVTMLPVLLVTRDEELTNS